MKYIDFHLHTKFSDGICNPEEIVRDSSVKGLDAIAITDHDTVFGVQRARQAAEIYGVEVISGVELTTLKYHILGIGVDELNPVLQEAMVMSRYLQEGTAAKRVQAFSDMGVPIDLDLVKKHNPNCRISKSSIIMTALNDSQCRDYLSANLTANFYDLAYLLDKVKKEEDASHRISAQMAIDAIHFAGGKAFIAHPFKDVESMAELDDLIRLDIDGIEIQPNYNERNDLFKRYALDNRLLISYGSDYHGATHVHRPILGREENRVEKFW